MAAQPTKSVSTVSVTSTATALSVYNGENFLLREFQNKGTNTIYLGGSDVDDSGATGGIKILSGGTYSDTTKKSWYAICAAGETASVTVAVTTGAASSILEYPSFITGPTADATDVDAAIVDALATSPDIHGTDAAQGLTLVMRGGASSTATNAGGLTSLTGGAAGARGTGGAASLVGGAAGAGSSTNAGGVGGATAVTGGAGGAKADTGNAAGGAGGATAIAGGVGGATASSGSDAGGVGGAASLTGGAGGAASAGTGSGGAGAVATITGGAGGASAGGTGGAGGNVALVPGAVGSGGTPKPGIVRVGGTIPLFVPQVTPATMTTAATMTVANMLKRLITGNQSSGATVAYTLPTGTNMSGGMNASNDDSFQWTLINLSAAAADTLTVTANTDHTIVGAPIVLSAHSSTIQGSAATFRSRKVSATVWETYRVS